MISRGLSPHPLCFVLKTWSLNCCPFCTTLFVHDAGQIQQLLHSNTGWQKTKGEQRFAKYHNCIHHFKIDHIHFNCYWNKTKEDFFGIWHSCNNNYYQLVACQRFVDIPLHHNMDQICAGRDKCLSCSDDIHSQGKMEIWMIHLHWVRQYILLCTIKKVNNIIWIIIIVIIGWQTGLYVSLIVLIM